MPSALDFLNFGYNFTNFQTLIDWGNMEELFKRRRKSFNNFLQNNSHNYCTFPWNHKTCLQRIYVHVIVGQE